MFSSMVLTIEDGRDEAFYGSMIAHSKFAIMNLELTLQPSGHYTDWQRRC